MGQFAAQLLAEIEADRDILARLTEHVGGVAGGVKEWGAWLAEKVSRLKPKHGEADGLGTFEALEFLVVGIHGKWALWHTLSVVAGCDSRLQGTDFDPLAARAESQRDRVDQRRLTCTRSALCPNMEALVDQRKD
jgi:hypothetical protein